MLANNINLGEASAQREAQLEILVKRIGAGDPAAPHELYTMLQRGLRMITQFRGGSYSDDVLHEVFLVVSTAIKEGKVRNAGGVLAYARTVARRTCAEIITKDFKHADADVYALPLHAPGPSPEEALEHEERVSLMREQLAKLRPAEREILQRFYVRRESKEDICTDMQLTETQFRLHKSRAKAKLTSAIASRSRITIPRIPALTLAAKAG